MIFKSLLPLYATCVAMAEHISGSEDAFVAKMNEKAQVLGMKHTHFVNCCGLDADGHYTSARDIALMSRELITNHPDIFHYTTIWMENITHVTKRGESEFGLSNTNKLLRHYQGATGLKTGSTSKAGFCLSATAERNHISLIAVVMACQSAKERVKDCASLLDYGFSLCKIYTDKQPPALSSVPVHNGTKEFISCKYEKNFSYVFTSEINQNNIQKKVVFQKNLSAPIKKNQVIGRLEYSYNNKKIGAVSILDLIWLGSLIISTLSLMMLFSYLINEAQMESFEVPKKAPKGRMKYKVIFSSLTILLFALVSWTYVEGFMDTVPLTISHRGVDEENGVQNTIPALEATAKAKPDYVEMDIQETKITLWIRFSMIMMVCMEVQQPDQRMRQGWKKQKRIPV